MLQPFPLLNIPAAGLLFLLLLTGCSPAKQASQENDRPQAMREFRAAWVASVGNINWPSKPGLSTADQQKEALVLLDFLQQHHFNAVILQVRPQADALYKSDIEPWSYFLTGQQGKAPDPYYDPLEFWTVAAHERGIELHVWLNPYRAHHVSGDSISEQSVVKTHPDWVVHLKEGYWWMDPSKKEVQDRTAGVVMDLVKRYDIDGVHFDDYFYPYPSYNLDQDFPDSSSWKAYQNAGGKLSRGDWRRKSVNDLIERIYKEIKSVKPFVKFGLSPFGIWRPGYPASITGFDQHNQLYADARLWLNKGWIDYFTPQLYWTIRRQAQSFPVLLGWWEGENKKHRHLWPGISVGRDTGTRTVDETVNEIMITRGMLPKNMGVVHWSLGSVMKNSVLDSVLLAGVYKDEALVPPSPWLNKRAPGTPSVDIKKQADSLQVGWRPQNGNEVFRWVLYTKYGNGWSYRIFDRAKRTAILPLKNQRTKLNRIMLTAVGRTGNESPAKEISIDTN